MGGLLGQSGDGTRMYVSLLVLGLMATAAGVAMVGFGIPINEFGLGNTLLITGTTAIVGGLVLIGLADAVRQLRRIAESLMARPGPRMSRPLDPFEPLAPGGVRNGLGRIPFPPKPKMEGRGRGPAPLEPRLAAAPSIDTADEDALDRLRSSSPMTSAPEPRVMPERDEAPLSPGGPLATDVMPISRLDVSLRPAPSSDTTAQSELFESLWPADTRSGKAPEVEPKPQASDATKVGDEKERSEERKQDEGAAEPHAVSILKSGVVDGMAYTLYSDGSIEAELPQGTVRFASITELRVYLEKSA